MHNRVALNSHFFFQKSYDYNLDKKFFIADPIKILQPHHRTKHNDVF